MAVTQQQFDGFASRMDRNFDEVKGLLRAFEERVRNIETAQASTQPLVAAQIAALQTRQATHEREMNEIRAAMQQQGNSLALLGETLNTQKETVQALKNALPEMAQFVKSINTWAKWLAGIAAVLVSSGLLYLLGRVIYLAITGGKP